MNRQLVLNSRQMRAADAAAIAAGTPGTELMMRAGQAVAAAAQAMLPPVPSRVLVACGPGNNGGDGYIVASELAQAGHIVDVVQLSPPREGSDAAWAALRWNGAVGECAACRPDDHDLIVDAMFGTGLQRDLAGQAAELIGRINAAGKPVLAVDLPSGLDSDTGQARGVAIEAARTVTFAARKPANLLYPGRRLCGQVELADIGIPNAILAQGADTFANLPALWLGSLRWPQPDGHKYDRGHALVVSGGPAHTGAARMAARGALRAGAGLVTVVTPGRALSVNAAHLTAIMLKMCDDPDEFSDLLSDERLNAVLLGPALGVGETSRAWVAATLDADRATLLDADALTSFAGEPEALASLIEAGRENPVVVTPHQGEFRRLFSGENPQVRQIGAIASKVERARAAARFLGAVVVMKGADTVIASPDGRAAINENGSAYLATAGSGDVLGGIIAGLTAQHVPGFEAACAGVWMHAEAANRFGPGLIAEDIPETLPEVLRDLLRA